MDDINLTTKLNDKIRRSFDPISNKWYFSIVDVIDITTKSSDARNYWKVLKNRLKKTQNELVTACNQLKMEALDGKFYLTDTGDSETIFKILELISKESIPYFREYLGTLNAKKSANFISLEANKLKEEVTSFEAIKNESLSYPQFEENAEDFTIMIDMYRKNNSIIIEAFIAGVSLSDLNITATTQTVTIKGNREFLNKTNIEKYSTQEISWGKFSRSILLPYEIEINKIEATDKYGLITIIMPIIDKSYSRRVKIKSI